LAGDFAVQIAKMLGAQATGGWTNREATGPYRTITAAVARTFSDLVDLEL
jgi:hypothetical protein